MTDELPAYLPMPDFDTCGTCGADAAVNVFWDQGDGWTCNNCGATDMDER